MKKTIREWLLLLQEPERSLAQINMDDKNLKLNSSLGIDSIEAVDKEGVRGAIKTSLHNAFYWAKSPQGHDFWQDIINKVRSSDYEPPQGEDYDFVNRPKHYTDLGFSKEVIDMMVDIWGATQVASYCEMNAFKYKMRMGSKPDQPISRDFEKANWYLKKAKELRDLHQKIYI